MEVLIADSVLKEVEWRNYWSTSLTWLRKLWCHKLGTDCSTISTDIECASSPQLYVYFNEREAVV